MVGKTTHSPGKDADEACFLHRLFEILNHGGIRYAVMRNYLSLPDSADGSDLDLLISPLDAERGEALIQQAIQAEQGVPIGLSRSPGFLKLFVLGRHSRDSGRWWGLRLDVSFGLSYLGLPISAVDSDWPIQQHHGIQVLKPGFAGLLGVLKELLNNSQLDHRYWDDARNCAYSSWPQITQLLAPIGEKALLQLRSLLTEAQTPATPAASCRVIRSSLLRHVHKTAPLRALQQRVSFAWSKVRRFHAPPGRVLAILGVDGAGKSTNIQALLPVLNAATHNAVVVKHLRPGLLPPLARLIPGRAPSSGIQTNPHAGKPSGIFLSLFRLSYLYLDYLLGYWLLTRPIIARQPTILLYDRYAYDMYLDPLRFRISLPARVIRWYVSLVPRPDLIFCLHGDATTIAARKDELSVQETQRQMNALFDFAEQQAHTVLVSTEQSTQDSRDTILSALLQLLKQDQANGEHNASASSL